MSSSSKSSACESCSSKTSTCSPDSCGNTEKNEQELRIKNNMARIKYRIAIVSGKGGVGKSTGHRGPRDRPRKKRLYGRRFRCGRERP